eukprot:6206846-Prymnesium_polylepis.1
MRMRDGSCRGRASCFRGGRTVWRAGFLASESARAQLPHAVEWWVAGRRRCTRPGFAMDLDAVEAAMDRRDRGLYPRRTRSACA